MLKKIFLIGLLVLCMTTLAYGAINVFTQSLDRNAVKGGYAWTGNPTKDYAWKWGQEVEDRLDGTTYNQSFFFQPTTTAPTATEGRLYYNNTTNALTLYTGSAWETLEAGGDYASLDEAYDGGYGITVDGTALTLTTGTGDNNVTLAVVQNETDNNNDAVTITMGTGATGDALYINGIGGGIDVSADNWEIPNTGVLTCVGVAVGATNVVFTEPTTNDITLTADADSVLTILATSKEDLDINLHAANTLTLASSTGVDKVAWGTLDAHSGLESLVFDDAASTISLTSTGATDLSISQLGTADCSLILTGAGSGADALSLITNHATGVMKMASAYTMDIDAAGTIAIDNSAGDMILACAAGSFTLNAEEAVDDAINIDSAAGGFDMDIALSIAIATTESNADSINIDSAGGIDIDISGGAATEDFSVTTDTSITMTATENAAETIHLEENAGTSGSINIYANQGAAASATTEHDASIQLHSDAGGIGLYTTANLSDAIRIETNGGADEFITINNLQGTGADAVTISANAAGGNVDINSVLGSIYLEAEEDAANAVLIDVDGGNSTTMTLVATTGISVTEEAAAIQLWSKVGGIGIQSDGDLDDAIRIVADGGTTAEITIHNDQGNATDSIELISDAGGIHLNAAKPVWVPNAFEQDVVVLPTTTPMTILANNSGQVHMIPDTAGDTTINLPAEADGLHYKFVYVGAAADVQDWIITSGDDLEQFVGGLVHHDSDGELVGIVGSDQGSNSKLGVLTPEPGTWVEMWYDLATTSWYVTGTVISATDTAITFADQ